MCSPEVEHIQIPGQRPDGPPGRTPGPRRGPADTVQEIGRKYNPPVDPLALEEYRQLRAAIGARGQLRVALAFAAIAVWAIVASLLTTGMLVPVGALISLLVLVAGFEAVHALHIGAERIGRYLRVRYESEIGRQDGPAWETTIAAFGPGRLGLGRPAGAQFALLFSLAVAANLLVRALGALPIEVGALAVIHGIVILRILVATRASGRQRTDDEARFREILNAPGQQAR